MVLVEREQVTGTILVTIADGRTAGGALKTLAA